MSNMSGHMTINAMLVTFSAAATLVVEIAAGRMLAPYVGMSLYTWTAIIATVLAGLTLGNFFGGIAYRPGNARVNGMVMACMFAVAALATAAAPSLLQALAPGLSNDNSPVRSILALSLATFFVPSLCLGLVSPIATSLAQERAQRPALVLGVFFGLGAAGSIIGTLLAGYVFIGFIGSHGTMAAMAALDMVLAGLALTLGRSIWPAISMLTLSMLLAALLASWPALAAGKLCDQESDYYCIRVIEEAPGKRFMVLDHLVHGFNDRDDPSRLHSPYVALMDKLASKHVGPGKSAYFVGGGAYTLPRAWGHSHPKMYLTIAEVDPVVTQMARAKLWYKPSDETTIIHGDGRAGLRQLTTPQDVIIGDAFHDLSVPQHLTTTEFAREVADKLSDDGLYLLNIVDHAQKPRFMLSVLKSLAEVFPNVQVYSDQNALRQWGRTTFVLAASSQPLVTELTIGTNEFFAWPSLMIAQLNQNLMPLKLTDDFSPVDRLLLKP